MHLARIRTGTGMRVVIASDVLEPGDVFAVQIERLGTLRNRSVAEQEWVAPGG
jgi:2-keto-4-pentenoate hydratase/2-oxohepta-3-ene-1,7-dioic acid hydratase in catechol pathway